MNKLRRLGVAVAFTVALAIPAFAGEIQTTVTSPPPSQPAQTATAAGEMQNDVMGQIEIGRSEATAADSAAEIVLNLLQNVLSLL